MATESQPSNQSSHVITSLLAEVKKGNKQAEDQLIPLVYKELHRLSKYYMRREKAGHTLQTSALVNEAYLRLAGNQNIDWKDRAHFFAIAANIMRRILVDHARTRDAKKRGGAVQKVSLENAFVYADDQSWQVVAVHQALDKLQQFDERQCRIVELRFFAGLSVEETAEAMSISPNTVRREFDMARTWLYQELSKQMDGPNS